MRRNSSNLSLSLSAKSLLQRYSGGALPDGFGGEGGIRTPDTVARMPHFECGAFNHSATSPAGARARKPRQVREVLSEGLFGNKWFAQQRRHLHWVALGPKPRDRRGEPA